jgi:hypothetical protein
MQKAIAATCPAEQLKWLRTALAWKDLASLAKGGSVKVAANPCQPLKTSHSFRGAENRFLQSGSIVEAARQSIGCVAGQEEKWQTATTGDLRPQLGRVVPKP